MSEVSLPEEGALKTGQMSSINIIGETTEAIHKLLLDTYELGERPPRLEEDLKFVPKDREEVIYVYMYRTAQNPNLNRQKRLTLAPVEVPSDGPDGGTDMFYHRPPLLLDIFYLVCVHSKFRSDAERLLGWAMMTLHFTPKLVYRPRRFALPDGRIVDSMGRPWDPEAPLPQNKLQMEKVSLALVDDLTLGDAVNLYTLHEAPYRPFLTYRARAMLAGPLVSVDGGSTINMGDDLGLVPRSIPDPRAPSSAVGRIRKGKPIQKILQPPGPRAHNMRRRFEKPPEETGAEE